MVDLEKYGLLACCFLKGEQCCTSHVTSVRSLDTTTRAVLPRDGHDFFLSCEKFFRQLTRHLVMIRLTLKNMKNREKILILISPGDPSPGLQRIKVLIYQKRLTSKFAIILNRWFYPSQLIQGNGSDL